MKLYTHEEIVNFLNKEFADEINAETFMENLTPIELPSNEGIKQEAERLYPLTGDVGIDHRNHLRKKGFIDGMEWMRDKIKGGNNEQ